MSVPSNSTVIELTGSASGEASELTCCHCGDALAPDIIFGGLRFYVCRPCNRWAVPYPPIRDGSNA
jgi:hypothetical protein